MKYIDYMRLKTAAALLAALLAAPCAPAAPAKISAKIAQPAIIMGDKTVLKVQIVADRGANGRFPIFDGVAPDGVATLRGDTIELGASFKKSSIDLGSGREQIDYEISVQAFDSGYYSLPPIAYVTGHDTVYSERLSLKVLPVPARADDEMSDYTPVMPADKGPFWDSLPLWLLEWWWIGAVLLLLAASMTFFLIRYKRVGLRRRARLLPPYEEACKALDALRAKQLWQNGHEKEYYTELIDIMRRYISRRFEMPAMEMTTGQILVGVEKHERLRPYLDRFRAVLAVADFAKFANMRCTPEENEGAYSEVRSFVEHTRPTEQERKAETEDMKKLKPGDRRAHWERRRKKRRRQSSSSTGGNAAHSGGGGKEVKP